MLLQREGRIELRFDNIITRAQCEGQFGLFLAEDAQAISEGEEVVGFLFTETTEDSLHDTRFDIKSPSGRLMTCSKEQRQYVLCGERSLLEEGACFSNHAKEDSAGANTKISFVQPARLA
jgi:hypothetical protein